MQINNKFDSHIEAVYNSTNLEANSLVCDVTGGKTLTDVRDRLIFVTDMLDSAWMAAQAVFESKAKPEHALQIYDRAMSLLDEIDIEARKVALQEKSALLARIIAGSEEQYCGS